MNPQDDPEERIRELERPLAEAARASESGQAQPPGGYQPPPSPWAYGGPLSGPAPKPPSGNRLWWIVGTFIVIGLLALAGGIAAFAAHQLSGVRSIISSPPSVAGPFGPPSSHPTRARPVTPSPPGGRLSVAGINENRTIACNDNIVDVSGFPTRW